MGAKESTSTLKVKLWLILITS